MNASAQTRVSSKNADSQKHSSPRWQDFGFGLGESHPVHIYSAKSDSCTAPVYDMHYGAEFGIILSGRMRRYLDGWTADLEAGQVWLCGMWEPHGWEVVKAPCERLVFVVLPEMLLGPLPGDMSRREWLAPFIVTPGLRPQAEGSQRQELLGLARTVGEKLSLAEPLQGLWMRFLLLDMQLVLHRHWHAPTPVESSRSCPPDVLRGALEVVFSRRGLVSVDEAARFCGVSRSKLERACSHFMGVSFARFALRHRLHRAAAQLVQTRDPVKVIAMEWGFADASHLHRCFIRYYGCSPCQYRRTRGGQG